MSWPIDGRCSPPPPDGSPPDGSPTPSEGAYSNDPAATHPGPAEIPSFEQGNDYCRWTLRRPAAFVDLSEEAGSRMEKLVWLLAAAAS